MQKQGTNQGIIFKNSGVISPKIRDQLLLAW